ncbi:glycosyltransferase family 39 protein [Methanobacterium aggregans]|uniref:glycosyltransferase family 39 protein n=1 Tax=Methanobacterium aggregans TaxID=1615586 RepID=UPI001FDAA7B4|nr:glycosyltransferase family 39 protein [Methanobacterium aggregans]MBP2044843.1 hypothetical protein [Methanobacterium aggregans]
MDIIWNKHLFKKNEDLIIILAVYSLLALFLFNYYQYITNADGISYVGIAQSYVMGNWSDAINGYWGPLFSWLLIPFLLFAKTPLHASFAAKIISLVAGFFTIIGVDKLSKKLGIQRLFKLAILVTMIPVTLSFAFNVITPDLLVTCLLVYYLIIILDPTYPDKLSNGLFCGILGAAAFLAKSYALPFFIVHFVIFNLIYYVKETSKLKKKNLLKNFLLGISIFFVISGVWIGAISDKYGELSMGTSGAYNQALVGPESQGHPMYYQGLLKPSNNHAVSVWADPSYLKMEKWSPFYSTSDFKYQIEIIIENSAQIIQYLENFSIFFILIILFSLILINKPVFRDSKNILIYLLITLLIYCGGYVLILVEERYLYLICILLLIMAFYMVNKTYNLQIFNIKSRNILIVFLVFSFVVFPIINLVQFVNLEKGTYNLSQTLSTDYGIQGNIASNGEWETTLHLSYYGDSKYYGITKNTTDSNAIQRELEDNGIDYYFVWDQSVNLNLTDYKEITKNKIEGLKIYQRNKI